MQKIIFKFYGLSSSNTVRDSWIKDYLFRFTPPRELNDPFEVRPKLLFNEYSKEDYLLAEQKAKNDTMFQHADTIDKEKIRKFFLDPYPPKRIGEIKPWPQYIEEYNKTFNSFKEFDNYEAKIALNQFLESANHIRGIFSLTKTKRNLLMWSHYASEHKGIAIGFDTSHPFFSNNLHSVNYTNERIALSAVKGRIRVNGHLQEEFSNNDIGAFLRKPICWQYEKEVRMIKYLSEYDEIKKDMHFFKVPPIAIKQLILGAQISNENYELLLNQVSRNNKLNHIQVYKASLHPEKFSLGFKLIKK